MYKTFPTLVGLTRSEVDEITLGCISGFFRPDNTSRIKDWIRATGSRVFNNQARPIKIGKR
jgi:hypothetical protein